MNQTLPLTDEYYRLEAPGDAPAEVLKYNGQLLQLFSFLDGDKLIGLASLGGRPDEGAGIRVPGAWALPLTPAELAHARWLARTFFDRERYVTEEERERMLCRSCQGSRLVGDLHGHVILVTHETRAQLEADGAVVTECEGCHGFGVAGPEADALLSVAAEAES